MPLPISVQVCTLNEAANIADCLAAIRVNNPQEVIVVDGGSSDDTVSISRATGATVIEAGPVGLAQQRRIGYSATDLGYVAFVDADDRLSRDWLETMLNQLETGGYAALQSLLRVPGPHNFWTSGWDSYFLETIKPAADAIMVGRPALYRTDSLRGISGEPGMIIEDTEMSRDLELRGLRQGIGTAISYRACPDTAAENFSKWKGYGRGYRQFVRAHPDRKSAIVRHITWTIPVSRTVRPLLRGRLTQPLFGGLMAMNILRGYIRK